MLCLVLLAIVLVPWTDAQETETNLVDDKSQCIRKMIEWCDSMQYSQNDTRMSMISLSFRDSNGHSRILCIADSEGTNCSKNGSPWFACEPGHILTYKGQILTDTSTDVDDEICNTTNTAFNELSVQGMSPNSTTFIPNLESLHDMYKALDDEMQRFLKALKRQMSSFGRDFFGEYDGTFPFSDYDSVEPNDSRETSTDDSNQIERENK